MLPNDYLLIPKTRVDNMPTRNNFIPTSSGLRDNSDIIDVERAKHEMVDSLFKAVKAAGGDIDLIDERMTLGGMLDKLAVNGIRFIHKPMR